MMAIKTLIYKEIQEVFRTSKIYVLPLIFLFLGLTSPLSTKLLPELLANINGGIKIVLPEQHWFDAFLGFHKNLNQMALIAIILVFMGSVADEKNKGTAILVLTKPVSRAKFVISKFLVAWLLIIFSGFLGYSVCSAYTYLLFNDFQFASTFSAFILFLISATNLLAFTIAFSTILRSSIGAGGLALGYYIFNSLLPMIGSKITNLLPGNLVFLQSDILVGKSGFYDSYWTIIVTILLSVFILYIAVKKFNNEELYQL
jgi:ABC-2 type transport system permease protein